MQGDGISQRSHTGFEQELKCLGANLAFITLNLSES